MSILDRMTRLDDIIDLFEFMATAGASESSSFDGEDVKSIKKLLAENYDGIAAMMDFQIPYATLADAEAAGEPPTVTINATDYHRLVRVVGDSTDTNNGIYYWNGSALVQSDYDPLKYALRSNSKSDLTLALQASESRNTRDSYDDVWSIRDSAGRLGFGLTNDARVIANGMQLTDTQPHRDAAPGKFVINTSDGQLLLQVDDRGAVHISELMVGSVSNPRETGSLSVWSIDDLSGNQIVQFLRDGRVDMLAGPRMTETIATAITSDAIIDSALPVFNRRRISDAVSLGSICDADRVTFDVRQANGFALVDDSRPLVFLPVGGQSNSGAGGATGVEYATNPYPHHCVTFNGRNAGYGGNGLVSASELTQFESVNDADKSGQYPATLTAFAMEYQSRQSGVHGSGIASWTSWYGGQPLETFLRGTDTWENLMLGAEQTASVAAQYGRTLTCPAYVFIQGESGGTDYAATLTAYAADVTAELQIVLGLSDLPNFVFMQINSGNTATSPNGMETAQLSVGKAGIENVFLAGPMYQAPLGDNIHQNPIGRMIVADTLAVVLKELETAGTFEPLWPESVDLSGSTITVSFNKPVAIDSDWVPSSVPDCGFVYSDDASSADIVSVSASGSAVVIELSAVPTGTNPVLEYAMLNEETESAWANGIGQIYSDSGYPSFFHSEGYSVPATVRHYCVRFSESL